MKKLISVLSAFLLCTTLAVGANAEILYTVSKGYSETGNGILGYLSKDTNGNIVKNQKIYSEMKAPNSVYSILNAKNEQRVFVAQQQEIPLPQNKVFIFDPASKTKESPIKTMTWDNFSYKRQVATIGDFLYGCTFDNKIVRFDIKDDKFTEDKLCLFSDPEYQSGLEQRLEPIVSIGDKLFAVYTFAKWVSPGMTERNSLLVKFDKDLNVISKTELSKNVRVMKEYNGNLYTVANSHSVPRFIQKTNPDTMTVENILSEIDMKDKYPGWDYDFEDISFSGKGDIYILCVLNSREIFKYRIYKKTVKDFESSKILTDEDIFAEQETDSHSFPPIGILFDDTISKLAYADYTNLYVYDEDYKKDTPEEKRIHFTVADLGGEYIESIATLKTYTPEPEPVPSEGGSGGGGCNSGFAAVALLVTIPLIIRKKF